MDLRDVAFEFGGTTRVAATDAVGQLEIVVPGNVSVEVHARSGAGEVDLFGQTFDGLRVNVVRTFEPPGSQGRLVLDLETGLGQVVLTRQPQGIS